MFTPEAMSLTDTKQKAPGWDLLSSNWQVEAYWADGTYKGPVAYTEFFFAAQAAYDAALENLKGDRIIMKQRTRVIRKNWED